MRFALLIVMFLLASCASAPVPDLAYYRMPDLAHQVDPDHPVFDRPIVVESLLADGLYNDQAMLYVMRDQGSIKAYHYQFWDEPPGKLLQRRLIATLRAHRASALVADRLPPSLDSLRVSGRIVRFERVRQGEQWLARVRLELRVDLGSKVAPLLLSEYAADVAAETDTIQSTVRAFAVALDQSLDAFWVDLQRVPR